MSGGWVAFSPLCRRVADDLMECFVEAAGAGEAGVEGDGEDGLGCITELAAGFANADARHVVDGGEARMVLENGVEAAAVELCESGESGDRDVLGVMHFDVFDDSAHASERCGGASGGGAVDGNRGCEGGDDIESRGFDLTKTCWCGAVLCLDDTGYMKA